ncbi:MAG: alanine--tRNA ligase [Conexivisphaerales archaeon]
MTTKDTLRELFSKDPDRYYRVRLFDKEGFIRKRCRECGNFFWTLIGDKELCPSCEGYSFISNPPTSKKFGYTDAWKAMEAFFVKEGHTSIKRYPVVARWRPDLYFTVASIIDFQRIEAGKVVFDFPANPLVVPQMCLRFNDIENVGVTGRHYTSFCMVGQQALSNTNGYWKDRTIDLDFALLTDVFGIKKEDITFVEDVWLGYGAFGYSLEYYVRGLELGNAVFTEFEGEPESYRVMENPVVDMGAGLERFSWITHGTATSYEPVFGSVYRKISDMLGIDADHAVIKEYFGMAGRLDIDQLQDPAMVKHELAKKLGLSNDVVQKHIAPLEALFTVLDHSRTLLFAISDGALPSNVAGGYNLRVIFRRMKSILDRYNWKLGIDHVMELHALHLKSMYPELIESMDAIREVLDVESKRYDSSKVRMASIIEQMKKRSNITTDDMMKLYDSEGITPDLLKESGVNVHIPPDFYKRVTELHMTQKQNEEKIVFDVSFLPETELLFYEDQNLFDFDAKVLHIFNNKWIVLDKTAFFARAGGQEPDHGFIGDARVVEVIKYGNVVLHRVEGNLPAVGSMVSCSVDRERREIIMRHHTATHIINGAARKVLGPWVWQHSAYKDVDGARLDITHHSRITEEQLRRIEQLANEIVRQNIPVELQLLPRQEAEKRYGFRLYQGGVVPTKILRVRKIDDFDIEACGGTHCERTGDIGLIKIIKSERLQDGVERIQFLAGKTALDYVEKQEETINKLLSSFSTQQENLVKVTEGFRDALEQLKKRYKGISRMLAEELAESYKKIALAVGDVYLIFISEDYLDDQSHIVIGEFMTQKIPELVYAGLWVSNGKSRLVIFSGKEAIRYGINAAELVKKISSYLHGSGGGRQELGQGGGVEPKSVNYVKDLLIKEIKAMQR